MATKTEIYELRKKEENDFYNVEDFNNNMDTLETALTEFDDSGTAEGVTSFPEMLTKLVTGNKLAVTLKNLKAGLQFALHVGSIVNNCVTDNPNLPLSAAQGKALQDQLATLNSNLSATNKILNNKADSSSVLKNTSSNRIGDVTLHDFAGQGSIMMSIDNDYYVLPMTTGNFCPLSFKILVNGTDKKMQIVWYADGNLYTSYVNLL